MQFVDFRERTVLIAEHQEEYITLPAHQVGDKDGTTFIKLQLSEEEKAYVARTGCLYMSVLTFGKNFPPLMVYAKSPFPYVQPLTSELSVIYFKDTDTVYFYTPDGQPITYQTHNDFEKWTEVIGYSTLKYYRVRKVLSKIKIEITYDKKTGGLLWLNPQCYYDND